MTVVRAGLRGVHVDAESAGDRPQVGLAEGVAVVLVGPAEELLFRGVIQALLIDAVGVVPGLVGMSVLFGLYHYPNSVDSVESTDANALGEMAVSGAGGVVLGVLYLITGNLLVSIAERSIYDASLFIYLHLRG